MGSDLFELFELRAHQAGAQVVRVSRPGQASECISNILRDNNSRRVVLAPSFLFAEMRLPAVLQDAGITVLTGPEAQAVEAEAGLTEAELGIAETGSLYQDATPLVTRWASMLPPVHIAVLRTPDIVGTLEEALSRILAHGQPPAYGAIITGPSRTADIERVLTIGVHGPAQLHIVCIDQPQAAQRAASS